MVMGSLLLVLVYVSVVMGSLLLASASLVCAIQIFFEQKQL